MQQIYKIQLYFNIIPKLGNKFFCKALAQKKLVRAFVIGYKLTKFYDSIRLVHIN